jgi:hypothetical protein
MAKSAGYLPEAARTVGGLIDARLYVKWSCMTCGADGVADLLAIQQACGPGYSLVDRKVPCKAAGCAGPVHFLYSAGPGTPLVPLRDDRRRADTAKTAAARAQLEALRIAYNRVAPAAGAPGIPPTPWRLRS